MEALRDRPLFTRVYEDPAKFFPQQNAAYIYGVFEQRSEHIDRWSSDPNVQKVRVEDLGTNAIKTDVTSGEIGLRNRNDLERFLRGLKRDHIYIDVTGLGHHVWAPLMRVALELNLRTDVTYVEPQKYRPSLTPRKGEMFDLSEQIEGISPLPLFTSLAEAEPEGVCFVPLLGFEGARLAYMIEQIDPPGQKIVPVMGVPGFQIEYPFHTYLGNQPALESTQAWKRAQFARANCPFSAYYVLEDILRAHPLDHMKIALIGTKPHALGAVLLCSSSKRPIELVYDHPRRKKQRTEGAAHLLEYAVSDFLPRVAPNN